MGARTEPARENVVESGAEPEFVITDIVRAEPISGGMMRLYLAARKRRTMVVQFTVIASLEDFAKIAKQVMEMATDRHNLAMWEDFLEEDGH